MCVFRSREVEVGFHGEGLVASFSYVAGSEGLKSLTSEKKSVRKNLAYRPCR